MVYVSYSFYILTAVLLLVYYLLPFRYRWYVLLAGSLYFFWSIDFRGFWVFLGTVLLSYLLGLALEPQSRVPKRKAQRKNHTVRRRVLFILSLAAVLLPLVTSKSLDFAADLADAATSGNWIIPLGVSFYTLQIVSYLTDVYLGRIEPQRNLLRYVLFVSFFPQIVQGPIPRYKELGEQLYEGHPFREADFVKGLQLIIWGFFLKFMIADRAGIIVDTIFDQYPLYGGWYVLVGGVLYSLQLYTDFLACVVISQGTASLFGIALQDNFLRPYRARSVREFWHRWHMTLSRWLRDYIYIPLGGNRKGKASKYTNLAVTFTVSGLWHGAGLQYLVWGLMHAFYQIGGEMAAPVKEKLYAKVRIEPDSSFRRGLEVVVTFLLVMVAWIIFRAENLEVGVGMLGSMVTTYNPWILFDDSLLRLGLDWKEFLLLILSIAILWFVEAKQENQRIRDWILDQHLLVRWGIYIAAILFIVVFGAYGYGFDASDFIYGGF